MAGSPVRLSLKVQDIIDGHDRFPGDRDEKSNVLRKSFVKAVNSGQALPWGCPVLLDLSAYDANGEELSADDLIAQGLAFKSEFIETMPDGSVREHHGEGGKGFGGAKYQSSHGMGTRLPAYEDLNGGKVKVEARLAGLSAAIEYAVS